MTGATATRPAQSVVERYGSITSGSEFSQTLEKSWEALTEIKNLMTQLVQQEKLQPVEAIGIMACSSAQVFGYAAFHGEPNTVDLLTTFGPEWSRRSNNP